MIWICFNQTDTSLCGFVISGHAGAGPFGQDVVCAAVSSAAYMAANTLTDVLSIPADVVVEDGYLAIAISPQHCAVAWPVLEGLRLHLTALSHDYPAHIQLQITEV